MYNALAKFYDRLMEGVDYTRWADSVADKLAGKQTGVDLGCGSGKFTLELARLGKNVIGIDSSPQMLNAAMENAARAGQKIQFLQQDAGVLQLARPVEFVTAMCDLINYIEHPTTVFERVYDSLVSGGVFIFDISDSDKLKNTLGDNTIAETLDDLAYIWQNSTKNNRVDMELTFFLRNSDGTFSRSVERQTQFIHEKDALLSALTDVGFKARTFMPKAGATITKSRIHFFAEKS